MRVPFADRFVDARKWNVSFKNKTLYVDKRKCYFLLASSVQIHQGPLRLRPTPKIYAESFEVLRQTAAEVP